jgi:hypothetical protein
VLAFVDRFDPDAEIVDDLGTDRFCGEDRRRARNVEVSVTTVIISSGPKEALLLDFDKRNARDDPRRGEGR